MSVTGMGAMAVWAVLILALHMCQAQPNVINYPLESGATVVNVREDVNAGTTVLDITTQNPANTVINGITISAVPGGTVLPTSFTLVGNRISTSDQLDFETYTAYFITVKATRTIGGTSTTGTAMFTVQVEDVNDEPVTISSLIPVGSYTSNFAEEQDPGRSAIVFKLSVTDADADDTHTWSVGGTDAQYFTTDVPDPVNRICNIIATQRLDRESNSSPMTLSVTVEDSAGLVDSQTLTVYLDDINDNRPVCQSSPNVISVPENTGGGVQIGSLACTDDDDSVNAQIITYNIVSGDDGTAKFTTDSNNIKTTANVLDYETRSYYKLLVDVVDNGATTRLTGTATVDVFVAPLNEHPPVFNPSIYNTAVDENVVVGTSVATVTATDVDTGLLHGTIHYSIVAGNGEGIFTINSDTGLVTVTAIAPDRETTPIHVLTIFARDGDPGTGKSASTSMTVTVNDVNDNVPKCSPDAYQATIVETSLVGASVVTLTGSDDDLAPSLTFSVTAGGLPVFGFTGSTLTLAQTVDFETTTSYSLTVAVSDGTYSADCRVLVIVQSVNEDPPSISVPNQSVTLPETVSVGHLVLDVDATDTDLGVGGTSITYNITSGNTNGDFYCNPYTGEVTVWNALDYDQLPNTYNMTIQAWDDAGGTDTMWLEVILQDFNDQTPTFSRNVYTFTINENVPNDTSVGSVVTRDTDNGLAGVVTYTALSGNGYLLFYVHPGTGEIFTNTTLDYETQTIYDLVIEAADSGTPPLSSTALVHIKVKDINDNAPRFTPSDFTVSIPETSVVSTSVTTVAAADVDSAASNNVFLYSLIDTYFQVDPNTGVITTKAVVDRETKASHVLKVIAPDNGTPVKTGTATVTVEITDVNDNDPVVVGSYNIPVSEDDSAGTIVTTLTVTDADDGDNARLTYTIVSGNTDSDFKISDSTGIIQVANSLDRERTASYTLIVDIKDNGVTIQLSTSATVTITIVDVNDNYPIWDSASYAFSLFENLASPHAVGTVSATDADTGTNAVLTYRVDVFWVGDGSHFFLNANTGEITTTTALDREVTPEYHTRLIVTDGGVPQRSAMVNVSIAVLDRNDNAPVFSQALYEATTPENEPVNTAVHTIVVTDADTGTNDDITLSIDTSTAAGVRANTFLQVTSSNGIISVKSVIDREVDASFAFTLLAVDGGVPQLTSSTSVTVTVTDINDNAPVFVSTYYNTEIAYTGSCRTSIVTVSATDADIGVNGEVSYFLSTSGYSGTVSVDATSGLVSLISGLQARSMHHIEVSARDGGTSSLTSAVPALIRVDALYPNDHVLVFKMGITLSVFNSQLSTFLSQVQARMRTQYPTAVARLWCAVVNSDGYTDAYVYFLKDDTTEYAANKNEVKNIMTQAEARALFTSDSIGTPNSAMQASQWAPFNIQSIQPYYELQKPWYETEEGICILAAIGLLGLCLLALSCYMCVRYCRLLKRRLRCCPKRKKKPPKQKKKPLSVVALPEPPPPPPAPPHWAFQKADPPKLPQAGPGFFTWTKSPKLNA